MKDGHYLILAERLGVTFKNLSLLKTALIHRSYLNEHRKEVLEHNERLEFLGDAVLELVVTKYLFDNFNKPEGELTNLRAALVRGENLAKVSRELEIGDFLLLSKGEGRAGGRSSNYILANAVEAIIGAIYLDCGYDVAKGFIEKFIIKELSRIIKENLYRDAKSLFQEKAQEFLSITPAYQLVDESGPDHDKFFTIGVFLDKELIAKGVGKSKQEAEQQAALEGLKKKGWEE